jgi:hypothetical protein
MEGEAMPVFFFLIVLPALQWIGILVFLLIACGIVTSYIKQAITHYYSTKMAYMQAVFIAPSKEGDPLGLGERLVRK